MTNIEGERNPVETALISDSTLDFIDALNFNINSGVNISFRTFANYRVSYIPACRSSLTNLDAPSLEINSAGIDALFYARAVPGEEGQIGIVRTILMSGYSGAGESEIGVERTLSLDENQAAAAVAMRPSRADAVSVLMGLTPDEELALSNRQAELLAEARKLEAEHQAAVDVSNQAGILHLVTTERPAGIE